MAKIPGWVSAEIGNLVMPQSGSRPYGGATLDSGEIPSLGGENIKMSGGVIYEPVKKVPEHFFHQMKKGILRDKDVLINKDGANTGKVGLYSATNYQVACVNEHVFILRADTNSLTQEFLYYLLLSDYGQKKIKDKISGSAQPGLGSTFLKGFVTQIPASLAEQHQITDILSMLDEAIAQSESLVRKYQYIKQGLMFDVLTRGVDENGELRDFVPHVFKPSEFGDIPKEWNVVSCSSICSEIIVGIVIRPAQYYVTEGVPALRSKNIKVNGIDDSDLVFISDKSNRLLSKSMLKKGNVVTVRTGEPGTSCVIPDDYDGANCIDLIISRPKPNVDPAYLALWINSPFGKNQVLQRQGGLAQQHFNVGHQKELMIAMPSFDEQQRITAMLNTQQELIEQELALIDKLLLVKQGLMQDLLSGQVRVGNTS
jgi:type I restriction enzyme S subunit